MFRVAALPILPHTLFESPLAALGPHHWAGLCVAGRIEVLS